MALWAVAQTAGLGQTPIPNRPPLPEVALQRPLNGEAAIAALGKDLPGIASHHRLTEDRLRELFTTDPDLWTDRDGRLYFAESHVPPFELAPATAESLNASAALVPLDQTFLLHSRPSATRKVFLDFDGHTTSGTSWRDIKDGDSTFVTPPYDFDGVSASFSNLELERIQYIWQRVAEDFAPFDVDITTEDPGLEGLRKTSSGDLAYGVRVCIGGASTDWYSTSGYGGVAYIGSFDWNSDTPCYVWENNLGNGNEKYVAEAISHEVGHTLDLYHDGTSTVGYYEGHGSGADAWAPIMGVGYYKSVVQFSKGEYLNANNTEDDLAKITASYNIPYIVDDHGNVFTTATALPSGTVYTEGLIERTSDVDYFTFTAGDGPLSLTINVDSRSPNLNVEAKLYDSSGTLVAVSSPPLSLGASFAINPLPAGTYYLTVDGVGSGDPLSTGYSEYGSLGIYSISGNIPLSGYPVASASYTVLSQSAPFDVQLSSAGSADPDGGALAYLWDLGNGQSSTEPNPITTYAVAGTYPVTLTVTDDEGFSASTSIQVVCADPIPTAPSQLAAAATSSSRMDLNWTDTASNETGFRIERSTDGVNFAEIGTAGANVQAYADTTVAAGSQYSYRVRAYNATGASAYSNTATATTPQTAPAAPSGLTAKAASSSQINLKWADASNNESGFYVEHSTNGSTWTRIATLGVNQTTYASTGLSANTTYWYRVQAFNTVGNSAYSNSASTKTRR